MFMHINLEYIFINKIYQIRIYNCGNEHPLIRHENIGVNIGSQKYQIHVIGVEGLKS